MEFIGVISEGMKIPMRVVLRFQCALFSLFLKRACDNLTTGSIFSALCKVILLSDKPCYHEMTTSIPFLLLSVSKNNNVTSSHLICFFIFFKKIVQLICFRLLSLYSGLFSLTKYYHDDHFFPPGRDEWLSKVNKHPSLPLP